MINIRQFSTRDADFNVRLDALLAFETAQDRSVDAAVASILDNVAVRGDAALIDYTRQFDRWSPSSMDELEVPPARLRQSLDGLNARLRAALTVASERIRRYHERQKIESWQYTESDGTVLGQQVTALDRAGLYVPGGKAAYPSSVLMNAIDCLLYTYDAA